MDQLLAAVFALFTSFTDVSSGKALMQTAKDNRLTIDTAVQHIAAAEFAGALYGVDPNLVLAIAYHESRFTQGVEGPLLSNGKRACGVMQHVPVMGPCPKRSLIEDYAAGTAHLAIWIRAEHGDIERALAGYAGGYPGVARFEEGAPRAVAIVRLNLARAKSIKRARELAQPRPETRKHDVSPS
jgi:soluble lytic murein transglycosylase-like protein